MPDGKEYISRPDEKGNIRISEEVLAVIAADAANEVDGVAGFNGNLAQQIMGKSQKKGIRILMGDDAVVLELDILIKYGYTIPDVARKVQDAVMSAVEATSGLNVEAVNVTVSGVMFPKETAQSPC
ncbi:Alkaline shock protein 23 [bioreactor metagenome]|uniref:Alkaline shock protein 23 n=1 Tax=bioreactor metagenome TaxID=1076179 RepID=A0A645CHM3_9ZZZZ